MEQISASKAYLLMERGPVVLVTTRDGKGAANVMTMGFQMMVQHFPPMIAGVIGPWDHSYAALDETGECVIAIPTVDMAETIVDIGNCSGRDVNKFAKFGLTALDGAKVAPPLIGECYANIECKVVDRALVDRFSLWVFEAAAIWIDRDRRETRIFHHNGDGTFSAEGERIDLQDRMVLWKSFQVPL